MRAIVLALAALLLPAAAVAQPSEAAVSLQQLGQWGQKVAAAQQPVIDSYTRCAPLIREITALLDAPGAAPTPEVSIRLVGDIRGCLASMRTASAQASDALARTEAMPASVERALGIDSKDLLQRTSRSIAGTVTFVERVEEALEASIAGDETLASRKRAEARETAGSVADGQILILEMLRRSLPLQTHKAMIDIRLAISRGVRTLVTHDPAGDRDALARDVRAHGLAARTAAATMRTSWKSEGASLRKMVTQINDPRRTALVETLDKAFDEMAGVGDAVGAAMNPISPADLSESNMLRMIDTLSIQEVRMLEAARKLAVAAAGQV